jgi:hypothetical protein
MNNFERDPRKPMPLFLPPLLPGPAASLLLLASGQGGKTRSSTSTSDQAEEPRTSLRVTLISQHNTTQHNTTP